MKLQDQIKAAVTRYAREEAGTEDREQSLRAAMLSGMTLAARYLAANEGSDTVTPQAFEKAALEVGRGMGFQAGGLR